MHTLAHSQIVSSSKNENDFLPFLAHFPNLSPIDIQAQPHSIRLVFQVFFCFLDSDASSHGNFWQFSLQASSRTRPRVSRPSSVLAQPVAIHSCRPDTATCHDFF